MLLLLMKRFTFLLVVATCVSLASVHAQSATDEAVSSISSIRRPTAATPAPGNASGPKKPLEASLSTDEKGKSPTTTFASNTPKIYLQWKDDSAVKGEKLRVVWFAEHAEGFSGRNKKLSEGTETLPGPGAFGLFYLPESSRGFPPGTYRAELFVAGKLAKTLPFTVTK
jgi:hypothetical protein